MSETAALSVCNFQKSYRHSSNGARFSYNERSIHPMTIDHYNDIMFFLTLSIFFGLFVSFVFSWFSRLLLLRTILTVVTVLLLWNHRFQSNSVTMASSHPNASMPFFARASKSSTEGWSEVDNFDVDLLAEYLLDDGNLTSSGVTFDFK
jgi:hypothetical protein